MTDTHLDIDLGNSFAKWRLGSGPVERLPSQALLTGAWPQQWSDQPPSIIRLASVQREATHLQLAQQLQQLGARVYLARASGEAAGVRSGYQQPERLGVDRWLALLAVHQQRLGDLLLVDAGTAITLDLLRADGEHLGGYILPGLQSLRASLWSQTQGVKVDSPDLQVTLQPGKTTAQGFAAAVTAAVQGVVTQGAACLLQPQLVFCGGDAQWLAEACAPLGMPLHFLPHAVLDGLALCQLQPVAQAD